MERSIGGQSQNTEISKAQLLSKSLLVSRHGTPSPEPGRSNKQSAGGGTRRPVMGFALSRKTREPLFRPLVSGYTNPEYRVSSSVSVPNHYEATPVTTGSATRVHVTPRFWY